MVRMLDKGSISDGTRSNFGSLSCRVMQGQVRFPVSARRGSLLMKSMKKRRRRRRREGRKAELEMRAMGTLHIGRRRRRSIGMTRGRGGRLKCIDMATQYKREGEGGLLRTKGQERKTRLR